MEGVIANPMVADHEVIFTKTYASNRIVIFQRAASNKFMTNPSPQLEWWRQTTVPPSPFNHSLIHDKISKLPTYLG